MLKAYLKQIADTSIRGDAREESHYPVLKDLFNEYSTSTGKKKNTYRRRKNDYYRLVEGIKTGIYKEGNFLKCRWRDLNSHGPEPNGF